MKRSRRSRSRRWRSPHRVHQRRQRAVGVVVASLAAAGALWLAVLTDNPDPPSTTAINESGSHTSFDLVDRPDPEPYTPTLEDAMGRLSDPERPFNVLILGDSTALDTYYGWHVLTMQWLAEQTGRGWEMRQWNANRNVGVVRYYRQPRSTGNGQITVWNASAGGEAFPYAIRHINDLVPDGKKIDLLIVNHGHNVVPERSYYTDAIPFLDKLHDGRLSNAAMVMVEQNPEVGSVLRIHDIRHINDIVGVYADLHSLPVIDVYSAFEETGRVESLIDPISMRHPTHEGYRIWFEAAKAVLEPALPPLP